MNRKSLIIIYVLMAIALLVCLVDMPYGFYQLIRFVAMLTFALCAYGEYKFGNSEYAVALIALSLLFQPFIKIGLGRLLWNIIDVVVSVFLLYRAVAIGHRNHE